MRCRRLLFLGVCFFLLASASPAAGATFDFTPATYNQRGDGPFSYSVRSSRTGDYGWVAWKFSTEQYWHRCQHPGAEASLSNLPDGQYTIEATDDINVTWWAAQGQLYSGTVQNGCFRDPPRIPAGLGYTTHSFYVDTAPPSVGPPMVVRNGLQVLTSVDATDATTGVQSYRWTMGDGTVRTTVEPYLQHQYLTTGDWPASVAVTDLAGNLTSKSFTVSLPSAPPPASAVVGTPPQSTPPPKTAPKATSKASCREPRAALASSKRAFLRLRLAYRRNPTPSAKRAASKAKKRMLRARRLARKRCTFTL
jgi:hypothetical protein